MKGNDNNTGNEPEGVRIVSEETYRKRTGTCRKCEFKMPLPNSYVCMKCGCDMSKDAAVESKSCPAGYWEK